MKNTSRPKFPALSPRKHEGNCLFIFKDIRVTVVNSLRNGFKNYKG